VAKTLALGADLGGLALPFLKAADDSVEAVSNLLEQLTRELRITMFCIGAANLTDLRNTPHFVKV